MVKGLPTNATKAMFVQLLVEGADPSTPPTTSNLRSWVNAIRIPFTSAIDADPTTFAIKKTLGLKETAYILDRATMKILYKNNVKAGETPDDALTALAAMP